MTRYFYTDPLAAAWMAKHFGVNYLYFSQEDGGCQFYEGVGFRMELPNRNGRFYIQPDSLHLLTAQLGDLCKFRGITAIGEEDFESPQYWEVGERQQGWQEIIRRNGLAFHWPESEEA